MLFERVRQKPWYPGNDRKEMRLSAVENPFGYVFDGRSEGFEVQEAVATGTAQKFQ